MAVLEQIDFDATLRRLTPEATDLRHILRLAPSGKTVLLLCAISRFCGTAHPCQANKPCSPGAVFQNQPVPVLKNLPPAHEARRREPGPGRLQRPFPDLFLQRLKRPPTGTPCRHNPNLPALKRAATALFLIFGADHILSQAVHRKLAAFVLAQKLYMMFELLKAGLQFLVVPVVPLDVFTG